MLREILGFLRRLWYAVLVPYVIVALANLVTDGVEALSHLRETLRVLANFVCGRSHRAYPIHKSQLFALKQSALAEYRAAGGHVHSGEAEDTYMGDLNTTAASSTAEKGGASTTSLSASAAEEWSDSASSPTKHGRVVSAASRARRQASSTTSVALETGQSGAEGLASGSPLVAGGMSPATSLIWRGLEAVWDVVIERRLLRGKKGEVQEWLEPVVGRFLVPPSFPLSYDAGLHLLVGAFIGPIQQPTVATLPSRHLEPQWPPHYGARNQPSPSSTLGLQWDASTDDNSNSSATDLRDKSDGSDTFTGARSAASVAARASARRSQTAVARPKFRQVYRRESAKNIDLQSRHAPSHLIASITSNHVLSYQGTRQKVLVIDLDETLCHVSTSTADMLGPPTFSEVIPTLAGSEMFHVWERPYLRLFLATAAQLFNLVLFTSASKPYADTILRRIDPHNYIRERYYRQDCRLITRGALARHTAVEKQKKRLAQGTGNVSEAERTTDGEAWRAPRASPENVASVPAPSQPTASPLMDDRVRRRLTAHSQDSASASSASSEMSHAAVAEAAPDPLSRGDGAVLAVSGQDDDSRVEVKPAVPRLVFNENAKVLVKDLRVLKVPPELCVMIDNSEECTLLNRENALIIQPYIPSAEIQRQARLANEEGLPAVDPDEDEVLLSLLPLLECLLVAPDVRSVLRHGKIY